MNLIPIDIKWDGPRVIPIPELSCRTIVKLQQSGIGRTFLQGCNHCGTMGFLLLDACTDLATMHAILGGDDEDWKGTLDEQFLLRELTSYIESHPKQESFCFMCADY